MWLYCGYWNWWPSVENVVKAYIVYEYAGLGVVALNCRQTNKHLKWGPPVGGVGGLVQLQQHSGMVAQSKPTPKIA